MTILRRAGFALGLALLLAACERSYLDGRVTDVRGEALPGVTVREPGSADEQDLTNGLGHYRVPLSSATRHIEFSKSGYTSAKVAVDAAVRRGAAMADVVLWPLPQNPGVYVVNGQRFSETTWVVPRQFYLKDRTASYGAELPKDIREAAGEPFVVAFRTPRYNARLSRLVAAETEGGGDAPSIAVWVEAGTMAAALDPIDTPPEHQQPQLLRVQVGRPLEPGVYGIHWGALEGYSTLDARVFLFRVPEPPVASPESEAPATPANPDEKPGDAATPPSPSAAAKKEGPVALPKPIEAAETPAPAPHAQP